MKPGADGVGEASIKAQEGVDDELRHDLVSTCVRNGIAHAFDREDKKRLQHSFLAHADALPFSQEQLQYASADATAAAQLYAAPRTAAAWASTVGWWSAQ